MTHPSKSFIIQTVRFSFSCNGEGEEMRNMDLVEWASNHAESYLNRSIALFILLLAALLPTTALADGEPIFLDDFSSDTSANYIGTVTYGSSGTFNISGGTLNLAPGVSSTFDVFHNTAQLEAGQFVSVFAPAANPRDFYLTVSTTTRGPNTGTEDGIRWQVLTSGTFRSRTYRDASCTNIDYSSSDAALDLTLYVFRDSETSYRVGYDAGSGIIILDTLTITQTAGTAGLYVGLEAYTSGTRSFDNLLIDVISSLTVSIVKEPYLIYPGNETSMTVLWQLDGLKPCTLQWGEDTSYSTGSAISHEYGSDHQHKYTITHLKPGTKYYYRLVLSDENYSGSFRTAPHSFRNNLKFLAYGDTRSNPTGHNTICSAIVDTFTDDPNYQTFITHGGDWVYNDTEADWTDQFFNRSYSGTMEMLSKLPIQGCVGNHEFYGSNAVRFDKYWPYSYPNPSEGKYFSFDYGPAHVIVLDVVTYEYPADYDFSPVQLAWLENDLQNTDKQWKFLIFHTPGWAAGHSETKEWWIANNVNVQTKIQPLCEAYGVDIVFCGHYHYYSRCNVNGVQHITSGGGGAPFHTGAGDDPPYLVVGPIQELEFCKINIQGNQLEFQAVKAVDGSLIDNFFIDHGETGDLTGDGCVDLYDYSGFSRDWLAADSYADFNNSGMVDLIDVYLLVANYLYCPEEQDSDSMYISEFMAVNTVTATDEDGGYSDWIELFNNDTQPINLYNWYLTDDVSNLTKWRFPPTEVKGKGFLVVFASGKDRTFAGRQLHTNFSLDAAGEYLALVKPDGATVAWEYAPTYPPQTADVSYGLAMTE